MASPFPFPKTIKKGVSSAAATLGQVVLKSYGFELTVWDLPQRGVFHHHRTEGNRGRYRTHHLGSAAPPRRC